MKKKIATSLILAGLSMVSFSAQANDLLISNNTDLPSTSVINHGLCSTILKDAGVVKPHEQNHIVPSDKVKWACTIFPSNCQADVYLTNNCQGPLIASVTFDVNSGIKGIVVHAANYKVIGSGFNITLNQA